VKDVAILPTGFDRGLIYLSTLYNRKKNANGVNIVVVIALSLKSIMKEQA